MLMPLAVAGALTLSALSVQVPEADCPAPSEPSTTAESQEAMPDSSSLPLKLTVTLVLFHPLAFGAGEASAFAVGAVLSIESFTAPVAQWPTGSQLSSLEYSMYVPSREATVFGGSVGAPELGAGSVACQSMVTFPEYQPAAFGLRSGSPTTDGEALSIESFRVPVAQLPAGSQLSSLV